MSNYSSSKAYDDVPYNSRAYLSSQASQLWALGKLYNIDAADYHDCRVLELGCASGGNILTAAAAYPNASFVGIDYSSVQIDMGNQLISESGISNVKLMCMSIEEIDADLGEFDYIIAHGLLSWLPEHLHTKVFEICQQHLSANGLAYISFNAYPAWHFYEGLRKMMQFHIKPMQQEHQKLVRLYHLLYWQDS